MHLRPALAFGLRLILIGALALPPAAIAANGMESAAESSAMPCHDSDRHSPDRPERDGCPSGCCPEPSCNPSDCSMRVGTMIPASFVVPMSLSARQGFAPLVEPADGYSPRIPLRPPIA